MTKDLSWDTPAFSRMIRGSEPRWIAMPAARYETEQDAINAAREIARKRIYDAKVKPLSRSE